MGAQERHDPNRRRTLMMRCPHCPDSRLRERPAEHNVLVEVCPRCHGAWFDRGKLLEFSDAPVELDRQLGRGLDGAGPGEHPCPRCGDVLRAGRLPQRDVEAEQCRTCGGLWVEREQRRRAAEDRPGRLDLLLPEEQES
jgi:Zn-finger nucleic acid-binding protein